MNKLVTPAEINKISTFRKNENTDNQKRILKIPYEGNHHNELVKIENKLLDESV